MFKMEKFFYQNTLIGIRIRKFKPGTVLITEETEPLQALAMQQKAHTVIKPHSHTATKRITHTLQECIVVISGSVRVDLFGSGKKIIKRVTLRAGDLFITVSGGHAVTFLSDAKIYEIKNGPYVKDRVDYPAN